MKPFQNIFLKTRHLLSSYHVTTCLQQPHTPFRSQLIQHVSSLRRSRKEKSPGKCSHWFDDLTPWECAEDVAQTLQTNVIYEDGKEQYM